MVFRICSACRLLIYIRNWPSELHSSRVGAEVGVCACQCVCEAILHKMYSLNKEAQTSRKPTNIHLNCSFMCIPAPFSIYTVVSVCNAEHKQKVHTMHILFTMLPFSLFTHTCPPLPSYYVL